MTKLREFNSYDFLENNSKILWPILFNFFFFYYILNLIYMHNSYRYSTVGKT